MAFKFLDSGFKRLDLGLVRMRSLTFLSLRGLELGVTIGLSFGSGGRGRLCILAMAQAFRHTTLAFAAQVVALVEPTSAVGAGAGPAKPIGTFFSIVTRLLTIVCADGTFADHASTAVVRSEMALSRSNSQ